MHFQFDCLLVISSELTNGDFSSIGLSVKAPELLDVAMDTEGGPSINPEGDGGGVRLLRLTSTGGLALAAGVLGTMNPSILTVLPVLAKTRMLGPSYLS